MFSSNAAANTHTINHNMNANVMFTVWVQRENNLFYNDIVSVAETNANTLTVYLTEDSNVKVTVHSMSNIS